MDIRSYIASGSLEDYAQGSVSDQERREVQCLSKIYPEIRKALDLVELDMERFAGAYAKKAPAGLRDKILNEVRKHEQDASEQSERPAEPLETDVASSKTAEAPEAKVSGMKQAPTEPPQGRGSLHVGWAAAAAVLLAFGVWQFAENAAKSERLAAVEMQQSDLSEQLRAVNNQLAEVFDPAAKKVVLNGVGEQADKQLALLWNTNTGRVRIDPAVLPALPDDMQYQLWVLVDGKPSSMGVLPKGAADLLYAEGETRVGQTFAITAEPLGGKQRPSLHNLVAIGDVA
jgi:anti-sigma-K factor RskA